MLLHQQLVFRIVSQTVVWVFESSRYEEKHAVIIGCEVLAKDVSNFAQLSSTISGAILLPTNIVCDIQWKQPNHLTCEVKTFRYQSLGVYPNILSICCVSVSIHSPISIL